MRLRSSLPPAHTYKQTHNKKTRTQWHKQRNIKIKHKNKNSQRSHQSPIKHKNFQALPMLSPSFSHINDFIWNCQSHFCLATNTILKTKFSEFVPCKYTSSTGYSKKTFSLKKLVRFRLHNDSELGLCYLHHYIFCF